MKDFQKISDYYINFKDVETIFKFLCQIFEKGKDSIERNDENKIIIRIRFPCGLKEENLDFEILKKELSLEENINNLKTSVIFINNKMKNGKLVGDEKYEEIKNEIKCIKSDNYKNEILKTFLEKIYPIGSYYWSEKDTSPEILFGGKWTQISGRFLFAVDENHSIGTSGGEEKHILTIDEIPSHNHYYQKFNYDHCEHCSGGNNESVTYPNLWYGLSNFLVRENTENAGSGNPHNNMPPYITAYCWKRIK